VSAYVETWKQIGVALDRSERWCRYTAERPVDPLPVFKVGGTVRLQLADRDAWLARQRARPLSMRVAAALGLTQSDSDDQSSALSSDAAQSQ
jgi:glyoxylate carboligase